MQRRSEAKFLEQLQERGAACALLGRLLLQELSPELLRQLRQHFGAAEQGAPHDEGEVAGEGEALLARYFAATEREPETAELMELAADYAGLFLNAGLRPVHPYESYYRSAERLLMQAPRDEVRRLYAEAGLEIPASSQEPEDHLGYELEFQRHLCAQAAAAHEQGNDAALRESLRRQREFFGRHLQPWAPEFCQDMMAAATTEFYRGVGCLIRDFLRMERAFHAGQEAIRNGVS